MTTTPCKQDVIALAERLEKFQCVLESAQRQDNKIISVWSDDPVVVAKAAQALRHLASPSSYEAGRVTLEQIKAVCEDNAHVERKDLALRFIHQLTSRAIASLPADGGEVDYDTNDPMGVEKDIQSSDGGVEGHARLDHHAGTAREAPRLTTGRLTPPVQVDEAGIKPGPSEATPSIAGSVREALDWPKIEYPHRPDEASYEKIQLKEKLKKFGPEIVAQTILNYALALPKQGSFAGSLWAIAEWLTAALSAPVEAPVAWIEREALEFLCRDKKTTATVASGLLKKPFGDKVPLYATLRPLPSRDELERSVRFNSNQLLTDRAIDEQAKKIVTAILTLLGGSAR